MKQTYQISSLTFFDWPAGIRANLMYAHTDDGKTDMEFEVAIYFSFSLDYANLKIQK